jgi:SAM-dependent methyltransferase
MDNNKNDFSIMKPEVSMPYGDKISECIACACTEFEVLYKVTDTNQGVPGEWNLMICKQCGLGFIEPFPSQSQIESFYIDQFYTDDGQRFQGWVEYLRGMLAWIRGIDLNRIAPMKGRLLDFGAGAGHFSKAQEERGWEVYSVDPYSNKANSADLCKLDGDRIKLEFPNHYFDVITLWYVIEHLRNPAAAIAEFKRVLKPGGILVLAQQDFASVQARLFGPRWLILDPPRHLWQFNEVNLLKLTARYNFKKSLTSHSSIELGPFTILQSILNSLVGNENYLFCLLKNGGLHSKGKMSKKIPVGLALLSATLGIILSPLVLIIYYLLLLFGSGDVFTLYLIREQESPD